MKAERAEIFPHRWCAQLERHHEHFLPLCLTSRHAAARVLQKEKRRKIHFWHLIKCLLGGKTFRKACIADFLSLERLRNHSLDCRLKPFRCLLGAFLAFLPRDLTHQPTDLSRHSLVMDGKSKLSRIVTFFSSFSSSKHPNRQIR